MATATERSETMTVEAAAARYGIGRSLAYELARRGELPGVIKLGSRYVVSRRTLERTINGNTSDAEPTPFELTPRQEQLLAAASDEDIDQLLTILRELSPSLKETDQWPT